MANDINLTPEKDDEPELSLSGLSKAFAEALARGTEDDASEQAASSAEPYDQEAAEPQAIDATDRQPFDEPIEEDDEAGLEAEAEDPDIACPISPRTILEAMLFLGDPANQPLETSRAAELMRGVEPSEIAALVAELNDSYQRGGCPYRIRSVGAGHRLALDEKHHAVRDKFHGRIREARLSQAAIDVLAIVAYRQPIGADEVNRLRDKPSHHILAQLVRRRLLRVERPRTKPSRALYRTTDRFLNLFELESLDDLPESAELNRD